MLTTTITAAAAAGESSRGWGGPIALAVVAAVYITGATLHYAWMHRRDLPSPTEGDDPDRDVKPQVRADSDSADSVETFWWGRIGRARQMPRDEEIDLDLDDGRAEQQSGTRSDLDRWLAERVDRWRTTDIVKEGTRLHGVSESTIMRAIRRARANRVVEEHR